VIGSVGSANGVNQRKTFTSTICAHLKKAEKTTSTTSRYFARGAIPLGTRPRRRSLDNMAGTGGKRPGAGRPRNHGDLDKVMRRELQRTWLKRVHRLADRIFDAHEDLALGHYKEVTLPDGTTTRVYKKSPDGNSLRWMMEHIWGLAPLKIDLTETQTIEHRLTLEGQAQLRQAIGFAIPAHLRRNYDAITDLPPAAEEASGPGTPLPPPGA
jgi:hypothetical protein